MKIYVLPVESRFAPKSQPFLYPEYNDDYGVEQDFYRFLIKNKALLTNDSAQADWHYLPVFWTRYYLNNNYGKSGVKELSSYLQGLILNRSKTFTICQYDDGPIVDLGKTTIFLSSRQGKEGIDIPLLAKHVPLAYNLVLRRRYLASFVGRLGTSPLRKKMAKNLAGIESLKIIDGNVGTRRYMKTMARSRISLAPRGYGGSSFRFFESMQLGSVPFLVGDLDTRPFKKFIDWDKISLYASNPALCRGLIFSHSNRELRRMGKLARKVYNTKLAYGAWCNYVLKELESI